MAFKMTKNANRYRVNLILVASLCLCGCGNLARPGKKFIHNHHRKGKPATEEHKNNARLAMLEHAKLDIDCNCAAHKHYVMVYTEQYRKNLSDAHKNKKQSAEQRKTNSESHKKHAITKPENCRCLICTNRIPNSPTYIEKILQNLLSDYEEIIPFKKFGKYQVDVYVPELHVAFEADGEHWHEDKERDARRDAYLLEEFDLPVIRLTGKELHEIGKQR